jgi:hypothetical protein
MEGEPFKLQNDYHQRATGFLHRALELDEKSSKFEKLFLFTFVFIY